MKKILALVLALCMCLGMVATTALADNLPKSAFLGPVVTHGWVSGVTYNAEQYLTQLANEGKLEFKVYTSTNADEMTSQMDEAMLWGCGTAFEVTLKNPLQPNQNYFVQMSEGCISSEEYDVASPAIAGRDSWTFNTNSDNIIEDLIYIREVEGSEQPEKVKDVQPGDKAVFEIVFGEDAVAAALFCDAGSIDALETYFQKVIPAEPAEGEEPEEIAPVMAEITFPEAGEINWGVAFLDANGKLVYEITMITNVVVPEAE